MNREFDLGDILSVTTGYLCSPRHIDGVYDILGYMTGESLMTHQLPRASRACEPALLEQHPQLVNIVAPEWDWTCDVKEQVFAWLDAQKAIYGGTLPVTPLTEWHHIDPLQELVEMTETPDRIFVVAAGSSGTEETP
jgi:hypothetical protein